MSSHSQDPQTIVEESQERPDYRNPLVLEMSEADFQLWRHQPITQAVLLYLAHRRDSLGRDAIDFFLAGTLNKVEADGFRGRMLECGELCTLKLSDMHVFYGKQPDSQKAKPA